MTDNLMLDGEIGNVVSQIGAALRGQIMLVPNKEMNVVTWVGHQYQPTQLYFLLIQLLKSDSSPDYEKAAVLQSWLGSEMAKTANWIKGDPKLQRDRGF